MQSLVLCISMVGMFVIIIIFIIVFFPYNSLENITLLKCVSLEESQ